MIRRTDNRETKRPARRFSPDFIARDVSDIDFAYLRKLGIKACLIDLDDTVVERGQFVVSELVMQALNGAELPVYIATNRPKSRDLKNLKQDLGAKGVIHPHGPFGKPFRRYYLGALKELDLGATEVVMIGDRYLQDMMGANSAGIWSLLVLKLGKPVSHGDRLLSGIERAFTDSISERYVR